MDAERTGARYVTVGVEGTPEAFAAARFGAVEAAARGCSLLLAHAYDGGEASSAAGAAEEVMARAEVAEDLLNAVAEHVSALVPVAVERRLACRPAHALLRGLESVSHLVVLGQQGRLSGTRPPLRSLGGRLAAELRCPLVVVPRSWGPVADDRPVVVAVEEDAAWTGAFEHAFLLARRTGRGLVVLHAVPEGSDPTTVRRSEAWWRSSLPVQEETHPDVAVRTVAAPADPAELLVEASWDAWTVVLGQPHRGSLSPGWFLSTARRVLEVGQCPVVLVPAGAPPELAGRGVPGSSGRR